MEVPAQKEKLAVNNTSSRETKVPDLPPASHLETKKRKNGGNYRITWLSKRMIYLIIAASFTSVFLLITFSNSIVSYLASTTSVKLERSLSAAGVKEVESYSYNNYSSERVKEIGQSLVSSMYPKSKYSYEFYLLKDRGIQAFALPGGYIVVYAGLYGTLTTNELKGGLANEIQHVELQHGLKKFYSDMGFVSILSLIFGVGGDVAAPLKNVYALKYSRDLETEADLGGADILMNAGVKPQYLADALSKISEGTDGSPEWLSSHPDTSNRIKNLEQYIKQRNDSEY